MTKTVLLMLSRASCFLFAFNTEEELRTVCQSKHSSKKIYFA